MKTFIAGAIASAEEVNDNFTELADVLAVLPTANGVDPMQGAIPATGSLRIQAGSRVPWVDVNGYGNFEWPTPFTTCLITVVMTNGDNTGWGGHPVCGLAKPNLTTCYFRAEGAADGPVRINFIAIGV